MLTYDEMAATSHFEHTKPDFRLGLPGAMPGPINVTMVGAGSFFTNSILKDVVLIPDNRGGELRLVDVNADRLELARKLMLKIVEASGQAERWKVVASLDRLELLPGTDYLVNSIEVSGMECVRFDNDIPLEFGVSQNIGDTIGPGGLFKGLRTIPVWLEILKDSERLCPQAVVLNYTNPMNMMCLAAQRTSTMPVVGLCHSVQGTSEMLAGYAGIPYKDMKWKCAGINHLAWFTELSGPSPLHSGGGGRGKPAFTDLYPVLKEQARDRESKFAKAEPVRTDMMLHFGAFITESSGHLSEYLPYYRKRPVLLAKYTDTGYRGQESFYADNWPSWRKGQDEQRAKLISGEDPIKFDRTWEYGAWIIEAIEKNEPFVVHGNVSNAGGLIDNLPHDGCVELACLVNRNGVQPTRFGRLPRQMAAICESNMRMFDLAVEAILTRSKETAAQALMLDPLTSAVCSPEEIHKMTMRLFEAEGDYLPGYK